jgi:nitrate reductase molybdenum cofactor assembly chaperone NarJ/NarW
VIAFRVLAALLTYPRPELRAALPELDAVIAASTWIAPAQRSRLARLIAALRDADPFDLEEQYVELFDRTRSLSLHLFEHVHGDSRDRGAAMVDLKSIYERAGLRLRPDELPDYLPAVLEYLSCRPDDEARAMLADCGRILCEIGQRLAARGSHYAAVFDTLLIFAGEPGIDWAAPGQSEAAPDPDESWMDAPAFGPVDQLPDGASAPSAGGCARANATEVPLRHIPRARRDTPQLD